MVGWWGNQLISQELQPPVGLLNSERPVCGFGWVFTGFFSFPGLTPRRVNFDGRNPGFQQVIRL